MPAKTVMLWPELTAVLNIKWKSIVVQSQDTLNPLKRMVQHLLDEAKKQGATAAEAGISQETGLSATARLGEVESLEHHCDQSLGITVYFGQKKGSASSNDWSEASIKETVKSACSIARYTGEDAYAGLPETDLLATEFPDLDLNHPWPIDARAAIALAIECEAAARSHHPAISNSEGATVNSHQGIRVLGNSLGFLQGRESTRHSISCSVIAQHDGAMQRDHWYSVARNPEQLETASTVGAKAAERAVRRLQARSLSTRQCPVLYAAEVASGLLGSFVGAISGGNLYRKSSFLLNALDTRVFPEFVRIYEQPFLKAGLGSAAYDAEGVATRERDIASDGILRGYVLNSYSARKLGLHSTGNAGGVHNLSMDNTGHDFPALLKLMGSGLLVTELMGQGINMVTGDYSKGAAGFWVEQGEIQFPVEEITIAGNLKDMFENMVAVGNDVDYRGNIRTGSILIGHLSVAGNPE